MAKITDIIYASQWTVKTEEAVKSMTLAQLKSFILNNSEVEEDEDEESWIRVDKVNLYGKTYMLTGEGYGRDEFFISNDGRVFFLISLNHRVEIVDEPENNKEAQEPEQAHSKKQAMTDKRWYAVQETREDPWDNGSDDYLTAVSMLEEQGRGLIAVIDENTGCCIEEIEYEDLF